MSRQKQLICSSAFTIKTYHETCKKINSSCKDWVKSGSLNPKEITSGNGVLMTWENIPLGFYDIPTLNNMIYSRHLWESLIQNPMIKACMENKCFWGENHHADRDEVWIDQVSCRVTSMALGENNLVLGDIDIMNTPEGLKAYMLSQTGRLGNSTRGFGALDEIGNGLTNVNEDEYVHVCSDLVALPACSMAYSDTAGTSEYSRSEIDNMTQGLRDLVATAVQRHPDDLDLFAMFSKFNGGKYDKDVEALRQKKIAASLKRIK